MSAVLISSAPAFCGAFTTIVAPSGWSEPEVSGVTVAVGLNGTLSQPSTPTGVCVSVVAISRSHANFSSRCEVVVLEHSLGNVGIAQTRAAVEVELRHQHLQRRFHWQHRIDLGFIRDVVDFEILVIVAPPRNVAFKKEMDRTYQFPRGFDRNAKVERQPGWRVEVVHGPFQRRQRQRNSERFRHRFHFDRADDALCGTFGGFVFKGFDRTLRHRRLRIGGKPWRHVHAQSLYRRAFDVAAAVFHDELRTTPTGGDRRPG